MIIIAEISDKMESVPAMWGLMALLAAPFLFGAIHRKVAWLHLPVALAVSALVVYGAYCEAFIEADMKMAIREEMGWWWIINAITSALLPAMVAVLVLVWQLKKTKHPNSASHATLEHAPGAASSARGD